MATDRHEKLASRAMKTLEYHSSYIDSSKKEMGLEVYQRTFTKADIINVLPGFTRTFVDSFIAKKKEEGEVFGTPVPNTKRKVYSVEDVVELYEARGYEKMKQIRNDAKVIFVSSLKGGVTKTAASVTLAQSFRTHRNLIRYDLSTLVIDLDPQASATMYCAPSLSTGDNEYTAAQAMLADVSTEELLDKYILETNIKGVFVMPANILDGFIASKWDDLCAEHLPNQNMYAVLKENIIDRIKSEFSAVFVDCGPHLDAFLINSLYATDVLLSPIPPAQVDYQSTMKYLSRLPDLFDKIESTGLVLNRDEVPNYAFMTKMQNKIDHKDCERLTKRIFDADMIDASFPRLDAFERSGETYDTVISCSPKVYAGDSKSLKKARIAAEDFSEAVFEKVFPEVYFRGED